MIRPAALLVAITLAVTPALAADGPRTAAEIDFLLESVGSSDCTFIRNGSEHDAEAAQEHLAMKRRRGRRYFDTADEFIERIASKSSWTGKPYRIRCGEREQDAGDWFRALLDDYRADEARADAGPDSG